MSMRRTVMICWLSAMSAANTGGQAASDTAAGGQAASGAVTGAADTMSTAPAGAGRMVEFHFVAKPGEMQRMRIVNQSFGTVSMLGPLPPQKFSQRAEQELVIKCLEVRPDGSTLVEMTLPSVAMQMNMGGLRLSIDTRKPSASSQPVFGAMERVFAAITKVKCRVTYSSQGKPLKVEGLSRGIQDALAEVGPLMAVPGMKQLLDQVQGSLGDSALEEQLRSIFRLLPDGGKAKVGDTWSREWRVKPSMGDVGAKGQGEYELLGVEQFHGRTCAKIRVKSTLRTPPEPKQDAAGSATRPQVRPDRVKFSMNASGGNGAAYIDFASGTVVQFRETQRIAIEMSVEPDPSAQAGDVKEGLRKATSNMTTSVQIELLDDDGRSADASSRPAAVAGETTGTRPGDQ